MLFFEFLASCFLVLRSLCGRGLDRFLDFVNVGQRLRVEGNQRDSGLLERVNLLLVGCLLFLVVMTWAVQFNGSDDSGVLLSDQQEVNALAPDFSELLKRAWSVAVDKEQLRHAHLAENVQIFRLGGFVESAHEFLLGLVQQLELVHVLGLGFLGFFGRFLLLRRAFLVSAQKHHGSHCNDDKYDHVFHFSFFRC